MAPPAPAVAPATVAAMQVEPEPAKSERIVATPYAKKLAKQFNVDLAAVAGSGPSGRITATDVEVAAGKGPAPAAAPAAAAVAAPAPAPTPAAAPAAPAPASAPAPAGSVAFTSMQAGVARNMVDSLTVPTFHVGYTITTDALDALYKKVSDLLLYSISFYSSMLSVQIHSLCSRQFLGKGSICNRWLFFSKTI